MIESGITSKGQILSAGERAGAASLYTFDRNLARVEGVALLGTGRE